RPDDRAIGGEVEGVGARPAVNGCRHAFLGGDVDRVVAGPGQERQVKRVLEELEDADRGGTGALDESAVQVVGVGGGAAAVVEDQGVHAVPAGQGHLALDAVQGAGGVADVDDVLPRAQHHPDRPAGALEVDRVVAAADIQGGDFLNVDGVGHGE